MHHRHRMSGDVRVDPKRVRCRECHQRVRPVEASRKLERQRHRAARANGISIIEPPRGRRPREVAGTAAPAQLIEGDRAPTRRTRASIVLPLETSSDPDDTLRCRCSPGHHRVVAVGDDDPCARHSSSPPLGEHSNLARAIELVARQVEQDHRSGPCRRSGGWQPGLVDLEACSDTRLGPYQRRHMARRHVRSGCIGGDRPGRGQRRGQECGGGGLAVGPADEHGAAAACQVLEQLRVELEPHATPCHRPTPLPGEPGRTVHSLHRERGHRGAKPHRLSSPRQEDDPTGTWSEARRLSAPAPLVRRQAGAQRSPP